MAKSPFCTLQCIPNNQTKCEFRCQKLGLLEPYTSEIFSTKYSRDYNQSSSSSESGAGGSEGGRGGAGGEWRRVVATVEDADAEDAEVDADDAEAEEAAEYNDANGVYAREENITVSFGF